MGAKLLWIGLTMIEAMKVWNPFNMPLVTIVGAILMVIGCGLMLFDK